LLQIKLQNKTTAVVT